jgi:hypothetical protein
MCNVGEISDLREKERKSDSTWFVEQDDMETGAFFTLEMGQRLTPLRLRAVLPGAEKEGGSKSDRRDSSLRAE